jgi:hypothetical protein
MQTRPVLLKNTRARRPRTQFPVFNPNLPVSRLPQLPPPETPLPELPLVPELPEPSHVDPVRNVHIYDGQIEFRPVIPVYPQRDKDALFSRLQSLFSPESSKMIAKIRNGGNLDGANQYDASDLFYYLLLNAKGDDFYLNLNEQLTDMYRMGQCPQGRVIRLMSLVAAFVPASAPANAPSSEK